MSSLFAGFFGLLAVLVLVSTGDVWARLAWFVVLGGVSVAIFVRWSRQGIYAEEKGIEIRGGFTSRSLLWSEIEGFELRPGRRDMVAYVDLVDGTSVPARALNAGSGILPSMKRRAQAQVDELNRLLEEARSRGVVGR